MGVSLAWTRGLNADDAEALTKRLVLNEDILDKIKGFIDEKIAIARSTQLSKKSFEVSAWSEYQAYLNGQQSALEELKTLLQLRD